ncbi:hypothetical protein MZK49_22130 [Ensifer sesbaniae]|uniref:hypothetical protein n=1 Tax=Ensifer sesbaniae TaxID=1214071 RepID=UPI002000E560|nr:hypothetical protein [Ensifer sesbaniae]
MAVVYSVDLIKRHQVDQAYRLMEAVGYGVDVAGWRELCATTFARKYITPYSEEIITVENSRGYITGVCLMRTTHHRLYGRLLDVPVFIIISAGDTPGVCDALLEYLTTAARDKQCGFIRVASPDPANWPSPPGGPRRHDRGILIPVQ